MSKDSVSYRSVGDQVPMKIRLLKAAAELFANKGYHGTSLMDIARYCDVRKSTVFHHFPSKESLALDTVQSLQSHLDTELALFLEKNRSKSPEQRSIDFIEFVQRFSEDRPDAFLVNFMALELVDEAGSSFNTPVQTYFATWMEAFEQLLTPLHDKQARELATRSLIYLQGVQLMIKIKQVPTAMRQISHYLLEMWKVKA